MIDNDAYKDKGHFDRVAEILARTRAGGLGKLIGRSYNTRLDRERTGLGRSLCVQCRSGIVYRREGTAEPVAYCQALKQTVPPDISECSFFWAEGAPAIEELTALGIPLDVRPDAGGIYL